MAATKHAERIRTALSGRQSAIVLVDDLEQGLAVVDAYAAEHLEIQTENAPALAARVRNAGAIFVGAYSPVSLGDYSAGSTHVLPTAGCACHSSGLNVHSLDVYKRQPLVSDGRKAGADRASAAAGTRGRAGAQARGPRRGTAERHDPCLLYTSRCV